MGKEWANFTMMRQHNPYEVDRLGLSSLMVVKGPDRILKFKEPFVEQFGRHWHCLLAGRVCQTHRRGSLARRADRPGNHSGRPRLTGGYQNQFDAFKQLVHGPRMGSELRGTLEYQPRATTRTLKWDRTPCAKQITESSLARAKSLDQIRHVK